MRRLTATLCLTFTVLLGSVGVSESGDYATAVREWKPLAKQGHAKSQYNLGVMYRGGQGVTQDYKTAVEWFRLAAKQ